MRVADQRSLPFAVLCAAVSNQRPAMFMYTWPPLAHSVIQRPGPGAAPGLELGRVERLGQQPAPCSAKLTEPGAVIAGVERDGLP